MASEKQEQGRPSLNLRATPRMAFPPARVLLTAEIKGGDSLEEYYCPGLEWDWGDGSRSIQEGDCPPFDSATPIERRFTADHAYGIPGTYPIQLTLRRADKTIAVARTEVLIAGAPLE